jgi:hypothetical protein
MTRRPATPRTASSGEPATAGGWGGVLRGSVNSVVGAAGLNLPLRAVERLTRAIEQATTVLERMERATQQLDRLDADFIDQVSETLDVLMDMREDTRAMSERMVSLEDELRNLRSLLTQRLDRVPLLRPRRKDRVAVGEAKTTRSPGRGAKRRQQGPRRDR